MTRFIPNQQYRQKTRLISWWLNYAKSAKQIYIRCFIKQVSQSLNDDKSWQSKVNTERALLTFVVLVPYKYGQHLSADTVVPFSTRSSAFWALASCEKLEFKSSEFPDLDNTLMRAFLQSAHTWQNMAYIINHDSIQSYIIKITFTEFKGYDCSIYLYRPF